MDAGGTEAEFEEAWPELSKGILMERMFVTEREREARAKETEYASVLVPVKACSGAHTHSAPQDMDMHTLLHDAVKAVAGPVGPGLYRISYLDFGEHLFYEFR